MSLLAPDKDAPLEVLVVQRACGAWSWSVWSNRRLAFGREESQEAAEQAARDALRRLESVK